MIKYEHNSTHWEFYVHNNGIEIPFENWKNTNDIIYYFPLATLVDNGNATVVNGRCIVPNISIYLLDDDERTILKVPPVFNKIIRLRGDGMLNTPEFNYRIDIMSSTGDGSLYDFNVSGNVIDIEGRQYLLDENQYTLFKTIEEYESTPENYRTTDYNLRLFAKIKQVALTSGCELDSYLQNENVFVPEKMKIDVIKDGDEFRLAPAIDSEANHQFQDSFERGRRALSIYPTSNSDGERTRVVLTPEQTEGIREIKSHKGATKEELQEIVQHPTQFFDSEIFDLSELYSERVIEYGLYKPQFSPFISPYKSQWIPGADVYTPTEGTCKFVVENAQDLLELSEAINAAIENHEPVVHYKGTIIEIDDAKFLEGLAKKQLSNTSRPISKSEINNLPKGFGRKVLIIHENQDELTYSSTSVLPSESYTFHPNKCFDEQYSLKQHQIEGIAWLQHLWKHQASGCLLADDMGLGKTLQVLYFIDWVSRQTSTHNPYLIVAPISLLENWQQEYNRFFNVPRLAIETVSSRDIPRRLDQDVIKRLQSMDIVLTNYETVRNCQLNLCAVDFDIIVLDEAQKIKTPGTMITSACKALKSKMKIAMTGTPVENSLIDLWCIMDYCVPGLLGSNRDFKRQYVSPMATSFEELDSIGNEIRKQIGDYLLRRQKADVAKDLPEKIEHKESMLMPFEQKYIYIKTVEEYRSMFAVNKVDILRTLFLLRKISEHPYFLTDLFKDATYQQVIAASARLILTIGYLDKIKNQNEKAILFADHKNTQQMLQQVIYKRYGLTAMIINGDTPSQSSIYDGKISRQASIDKFQSSNGFNVIIMSPIAAGVGLNVTAANHVIHYSRHWNPAKESQATDRAYRIGQLKDVHVYYPMAVIEEMESFDIVLDNLLQRKSNIASSTIFPTERMEITQDEIISSLFGETKSIS